MGKDDAKRKEDNVNEILVQLGLQGLASDQAKEVLAAMRQAEAAEDEDDASDEDTQEDKSLLASVRRWMSEYGQADFGDETLRDFNLKVRFQGHVNTTPPDHLRCMVRILVEEACTACNLADVKQPTPVSKALQP